MVGKRFRQHQEGKQFLHEDILIFCFTYKSCVCGNSIKVRNSNFFEIGTTGAVEYLSFAKNTMKGRSDIVGTKFSPTADMNIFTINMSAFNIALKRVIRPVYLFFTLADNIAKLGHLPAGLQGLHDYSSSAGNKASSQC